MDIAELQAWAYFILTIFVTAVLYGYIYHLYTAKKKYNTDYEELSNIALNDDITDIPVSGKSEKIEGKDTK